MFARSLPQEAPVRRARSLTQEAPLTARIRIVSPPTPATVGARRVVGIYIYRSMVPPLVPLEMQFRHRCSSQEMVQRRSQHPPHN